MSEQTERDMRIWREGFEAGKREPAPAQAREEEALLRFIRETYSGNVWAHTSDECLAALRSRQSPQAGNCTACGKPVYHRAGKPGEYDHDCAAPQPSPQGEDASYNISQAQAAEWHTQLVQEEEENKRLRALLASANEEIGRLNRLVDAEAGLRRLAGEDKAEAWAKVRELEARPASAQSSAQGDEAREKAINAFRLDELDAVMLSVDEIALGAMEKEAEARAALERKNGK